MMPPPMQEKPMVIGHESAGYAFEPSLDGIYLIMPALRLLHYS